jgi:hypothetical protein
MSDTLALDGDRESCAAGDLVIRLITETGSLYELNLSTKIWRRLRKTERSGDLRAEGGQIWLIGPIFRGVSLSLVYLPFDGDRERLLVTSPVCWVGAGIIKPATPTGRGN